MTHYKDNRPGRPFLSLRLKVAVTLLIVLFAGLALSLKLALDLQARHLIRHIEHESMTITGIVEEQINSSMLSGNTENTREILTGLGFNGKVKGVWLTNHEGLVVVSSVPSDTGRNISEFSIPKLVEKRSGSIIPKGHMSGSAGPVYFQTVRFDNRMECRPCHMGEGTVLGWLAMEVSVDKELAELAEAKRSMVLGAVLLGVAIAFTATFTITRLVNRPIERLVGAMKEAETNLAVRVEKEGDDEIGLLSEGFNSLMDRLREVHADAERLHTNELGLYSSMLEATNLDLDDKVKKLSALSVIGRNMIEIKKLDDLLKMVLNTALRELSGESGSVMLYQEGVDELVIHSGIGLSPEGHRKSRFKLGEGIAGWVALNRNTAMVDSALDDDRYVPGRGMKHSVPILCVPLLGSKGNILGVVNIERLSSHHPFALSDMEYLTAMAGQASVAIENVELIYNLQKSYYDTISALAMTVEAKDPYTLGHSKRVTQYSIAIAEEMGLSGDEVRIIQYGATLHDIGKIGVRESVLNKPGRLDDDEMREIMDHAVIGENIVKGVDFLQKTRPIIRNHQERYDGKGYPDGMKGDEIPLKVAIVSVADNFDALTTDRPYRKAFPAPEVIEFIRRESGQKFNPEVVDAFLRIFEG